jgi:hypothetical protein
MRLAHCDSSDDVGWGSTGELERFDLTRCWVLWCVIAAGRWWGELGGNGSDCELTFWWTKGKKTGVRVKQLLEGLGYAFDGFTCMCRKKNSEHKKFQKFQ